MEENKYNSSISSRINKIEHHFIIKYDTKQTKDEYVELILKLIKKHEIKDYHIEEKKAFLKPKLKYNLHTISKNSKINIIDLDKEFLKYFQQ